MTTLRDQLDQIARLNEKATQGEYFTGIDDAHDTIPHKDSGLALIDNGTQSDWPVARLCEWPTADFLCALVNYYRSGALQRLAELAEEVSHIAKAERFNREKFGDDTAYADWVQSRCRFVLSARAPSVKEKGPCPLCGRTDPHSHTVGPGGMS
jgi:hypothetical protein